MPQIIHRKTVHRGPLFHIELLRVPGRDGDEHSFEVLRHPGGVVIVAVLDGHVLMVRNYRVSADDRLLELPAGKLEAGEDPEPAAARELEEETGYRAGRLTKIGEFFTTPGFCDELLRVFVAEDLQHVGQQLDPSEDIIVEEVPVTKAVEMACTGQLVDAKTIAGLLMWHVRTSREASADHNDAVET